MPRQDQRSETSAAIIERSARSARKLWRILIAVVAAAGSSAATAFEVGRFVSAVGDSSRNREIAYTLYYPLGSREPAHVLLFSHGGFGSTTGHTRLGHFGSRWATAGYVAVHVNHLASSPASAHQIDRPADVSYILDRLQAGTLPLPPDLMAPLVLDRFGHAGHSFGAYTSMALAGGDYEPFASFRDSRIAAIAPVSPQGADQFGAYDRGANDNTWGSISIPVLSWVGELEKDSNAFGTIVETDWRLTPFRRFPAFDDKYQVIVPGQDHLAMGEGASPEVASYLADNTRRFFDVHLKGEIGSACVIGLLPPFVGAEISALSDPQLGLATLCPPPIGVPEPSGGPTLAVGAAGWMAVLCATRGRPQCGSRSGP